MSHPVSNEHLLQGCATCVRRRAAEAVKAFSRGLSRMSETLNAAGRHDSIREARALNAQAEGLETGYARLTCAGCAETESDAEAKFCKRCGGGLVRSDIERDLPGTGAREWSGANNRRLRQQEDDDARRGAQRAAEAIKVFKQSADLEPQGKGATEAVRVFRQSANVRG